MNRMLSALCFALLFLLFPLCASADTRALLVACSDFVTQPDLGSAISGNLHMIGSALISSDMPLGNLSIEDGTIGTSEAFESAVVDAFSLSDEDDLSILYLCTHGVLSSADDGQVYLLLGDGEKETPLSADALYAIIRPIQGKKLLILDACFSGALIGRGGSGAQEETPDFLSPFLSDTSIHVLTSASGSESSWYYDSQHLDTGAVSYFASALSSGLGLYGTPEADLSGDGGVTLAELHRYLSVAVPSSSSQLLSAHADSLFLPVAAGPALSRPLSGFSYSTSLLSTDDPVFELSFTVTQADTGVQYRLIDYDNGRWSWENAQEFWDDGDEGGQQLAPGRKHRALSLENIAPEDSGYLMLQVFSVRGESIQLCSERLIAVQPAQRNPQLRVSCRDTLDRPGVRELPIDVYAAVPCEISVSVYDSDGALVRRLASSQLTRPAAGDLTRLYWDGRDASGAVVPDGDYTIAAETASGSGRIKTACSVSVRR